MMNVINVCVCCSAAGGVTLPRGIPTIINDDLCVCVNRVVEVCPVQP